MLQNCENCDPRTAHSCAYLRSRLMAVGEDSSTVHREYCTGTLTESEFSSLRKSLSQSGLEIRLLFDEYRCEAGCPGLASRDYPSV